MGHTQTFVVSNQAIHGVTNGCFIFFEFLFKHIHGAFHGGGQHFRLPILNRNPETAQGAPGGNVATHNAAANHMNMLWLKIFFIAL